MALLGRPGLSLPRGGTGFPRDLPSPLAAVPTGHHPLGQSPPQSSVGDAGWAGEHFAGGLGVGALFQTTVRRGRRLRREHRRGGTEGPRDREKFSR